MIEHSLAQEILYQARHMIHPLPIEDFAPVDEVQKWLDATDNTGDAEEISKEIYKLLQD